MAYKTDLNVKSDPEIKRDNRPNNTCFSKISNTIFISSATFVNWLCNLTELNLKHL